MPTHHYDVEAVVRRRGELVTVSNHGNDSTGWRDSNGEFHCYMRVTGDRRSRQIAERHWTLKKDGFWSSGGGSSYTVTIKPPKKREHVLIHRYD